jgi:hypothetical protein
VEQLRQPLEHHALNKFGAFCLKGGASYFHSSFHESSCHLGNHKTLYIREPDSSLPHVSPGEAGAELKVSDMQVVEIRFCQLMC